MNVFLFRSGAAGAALVVLFALGAGIASARTADQPWKNAADSTAFDKQAADVRKGMKSAGEYADISAADRAEVEKNLGVIKALLDHRGSVGSMSSAEQVDLANAQEKINALLTKNDDGRLICTLEQRSGTHFKTKVCLTARERREITKNNQEAFQDQLKQGSATQERGN